VRAVIAQSPFISLRAVVRYYAWRFFMLPPPVAMLGIRFFELVTGARAGDVDVARAVAGLATTPVLIIGSPHDRQVPYAWLQQLHALLPTSELVTGPYGHDDGTNMDVSDDGDVEHGLAFISAALAAPSAASSE
jgi:pimeloyl-ACP methyl ester carboxylesterase